jgi:hypothetical protein
MQPRVKAIWKEGVITMRPHFRAFPILSALAAVLLFSIQVFASLDRGQVQGTVTDPQGGVVPGVTVVVTNVDTAVAARLVTNSVGFYLAQELVPGKYSVRVEASGFAPLEITGVTVTAGTTLTQDAQVKVGPTAQSVEVTAQAHLLETTSSNFSVGVSRRYLDNLPLEGRDIQTLVSLFPGIIQSSGPSGAVFGSNSQFGGFPDPLHLVGSSVSANGGQAGANAWFLEGALNATVGAEAATVNPSPDAVSEFNIVQNGLAAEYGRTSGMVVNVVMKSGTNALHGDVYDVNRNSYFSATNPFARRDANGNPFLQPWTNWNNFGGTLGGPVVLPHLYNGKNRTFFFVSEEMSLLHERQNRILTVPLAAEKNGDFTGNPYYPAGANCTTPPYDSGCIFDPATTTYDSATGTFGRTPFPTPVIPQGRIDPLAKFYLDSIPAPNFVDPLSPCSPAYLCNNYIGTAGSSMTTHNASVKIDHTINDKQRFFASWLFNPSYYTNYRYPWNGPSAQLGTGIVGANPFTARNQLAIVGLTSTLSPTLVNEARFSFGRQNLVGGENPDSVTATQQIKQKVAGLNFWLYDPLQPVPTISFNNNEIGSSFQMGPPAYQDVTTGQQAWTANETLTKIWGRHTIKGGFTFRRNNLWGSSATGYNIGFSGMLTDNPANPYGGPNNNGLADFLLGAVGEGGGSSAIQESPWQTNDDYAAFGQDDFRLRSNFTVSVGVRWDVYGWIRERHDQIANFDLSLKNPEVNALGKLVYPGTPSHPDRNLFPANKGSFGPRFGFAWSPFGNSKTVIRGGYGLIYSNSLSAAFGQGNGAFSTMGSYVPVSTPVTDPYPVYNEIGGWTLSKGAPSIQFPNLTANRTNDFQYVGVSGGNIYGFLKGNKDPYVQQWNLSIQRELPGNILISAAYVGSHGSHLLEDEFRNTNQVPKSQYAKVRSHINDYTYQVDPSFNGLWGDCGQWDQPANNNVYCSGWYALEPYPFWWSIQSLLTPDGISKYHSGQLRVEKRYSHGLNFIASYTYSKNIVSAGLGALAANTFGPSTLGNRGVGRIAWIPGAAGGGSADGFKHTTADDVYNLRRYDALSPDDTPHVFNIASTYELPFGKGKKWMNTGRAAHAVLGGWKFTQIWNFQSGVPMFFTTQSACTGIGGTISCRPNVVGNLSAGRSSKTKAQREQQWYNASALCAPWGCDDNLTTTIYNANNAGDYATLDAIDAFWQLGNAGTRPPSGRIPGFWNADMSLAKDFHFSESKYFNFRWDVFNSLNHQNLGVPNNTWCLPPGPDGQLDSVHTFGCAFGQITNVQTDPRAMQFSLKFYW